MDFSQIELIYKSEGNANLVLMLPQQKKVLRLPKGLAENLSEDELNINCKAYAAYVKFLINLLANEYCTPPEIVSLTTSELNKIKCLVNSFRPIERLNKEISGKYAYLLPDTTFLPSDLSSKFETTLDTFAVEIKLKQGWPLNNSFLDDYIDLKGLDLCRYCSMQYTKLHNNKINKISDYCPLDLFSGNNEKMNKAIDGLLASPQNNFKIFKNGELVYGDKISVNNVLLLINEISESQKDVFNDLIIKCLLKDFENKETNAAYNTKPDKIHKLPSGCILQKIIDLQLLCKKKFKTVLNSIKTQTRTFNTLKKFIEKDKEGLHISDLNPQEQYMIGATMMDVSIMIAFKKLKYKTISDPHIVKIGYQYFLTKIMILDVDPKSDDHIIKYIKQTNAAYSIAKEYLKH